MCTKTQCVILIFVFFVFTFNTSPTKFHLFELQPFLQTIPFIGWLPISTFDGTDLESINKYSNGLYESPLEEIERSDILKIFIGNLNIFPFKVWTSVFLLIGKRFPSLLNLSKFDYFVVLMCKKPYFRRSFLRVGQWVLQSFVLLVG